MHDTCQSQVFDALVELDLSFTQTRLIFALSGEPKSLPINEVAERLGSSVATAGRNVDQLMGLGLVDRREDTADRRIKLVSLTDAGEKVARTYQDTMREQIRSFVRGVPDPEAAVLVDALNNALAGADLLAANSQDVAE